MDPYCCLRNAEPQFYQTQKPSRVFEAQSFCTLLDKCGGVSGLKIPSKASKFSLCWFLISIFVCWCS